MKIIIVLLSLLLVVGCSTKPVKISTVEVQKPPLVLPSVDQYHGRNLKWIIITPENYQGVFSNLQKQGKEPVLFGLTDDGYEAMALNMQDILKLLKQYQAIIAAYEEYYQGEQ